MTEDSLPDLTEAEVSFIRLRMLFHSYDELIRNITVRFNLVPTEYRALRQILRGNVNRPALLSDVLGITPAAVTDLIDRLEGRHLIRRVPSLHDRRMVNLELTPEGIQLVERVRKDLSPELQAIYDELPPEVHSFMREGLQQIHAAIQKRLPLEAGAGERGEVGGP